MHPHNHDVDLKAVTEQPDFSANAVGEHVPKFKKIENYTTFLAEYAEVGDDIILHFFPPAEAYVQVAGTDTWKVPAAVLRAWQLRFPEVLSPTAENHFRATAPKIVAQYVPEMTSWWMACRSYALTLDPDTLILSFLQKLDAALDAAGVSFLSAGSTPAPSRRTR